MNVLPSATCMDRTRKSRRRRPCIGRKSGLGARSAIVSVYGLLSTQVPVAAQWQPSLVPMGYRPCTCLGPRTPLRGEYGPLRGVVRVVGHQSQIVSTTTKDGIYPQPRFLRSTTVTALLVLQYFWERERELPFLTVCRKQLPYHWHSYRRSSGWYHFFYYYERLCTHFY